MTVAELITLLQQHDPALPVCVHDNEDGFCLVGGAVESVIFPASRPYGSTVPTPEPKLTLRLTLGAWAPEALFATEEEHG